MLNKDIKEKAVFALVIVTVYLLLYSLIIVPNYLVKKTVLNLGLNYTIAFISDLHFESFYLPIRYKKVLEIIKKSKAKVTIIGGDLVGSRDPKDINETIAFVKELENFTKVLIVPGNWDCHSRIISKQNIKRIDATLLINNVYRIKLAKNDTICIYGMDWLNPEYNESLLTNCTKIVVVAHTPAYYKLVKGNVTIILSGHTHCGQIRIFGKPIYVPDHLYNLDCGMKIINGTKIYITSGVGVFKYVPLRFGTEPEVVILK